MNIESGFLQPIGTQSVVSTVIDRITGAILAGELKPGSKIPTEMELTTLFGVGRNSVREAIKVLVYMGVLQIRRSEGTFVQEGFSDKMLNPLLYGLMLENHSSQSLIELRRIFEYGSLQLAVQQGTQDDIANIVKACDGFLLILRKNPVSAGEVLEADLRFHRFIDVATHNPLVERISAVVNRLTIPSRTRTIQRILDSGDANFLMEAHQRLRNILVSRDLSGAAETINFSYQYWEDSIDSEG
jgi:GntR family transcriptional repressor for pyruvate dehydrogenase complex